MRNLLRSFFFIVALCLPAERLFADVGCPVAQHQPPSEADQALLAADYAKAAALYQADLVSHPGSEELTAGLVHALLHQQKVREAAEQVKAALLVTPHSAALISLRGEVEYRQGTPWLADKSALESEKSDPCNPRNHLLLANLERLSSFYASSRKELRLAHQLDPEDPEIRSEWLHTLSLKKRITEMEAYLSAPNGSDEDEMRHWRMDLDRLKKLAAEPHKACRLVSPAATAEMPFVPIMADSTHIRAFGLDVKLNDRTARLQIDTGAGGLVVSRSVAERAGIKPFSQTEMAGIGDRGFKPGYTAFADSIRIGNLEFQDCAVRVLDSRSVVDLDGLIGMDVFSNFLVTLDYPKQKLQLGPLPPRPGESAAEAPALNTSHSDRDSSEAAADDSGKPDEAKPAAATSAVNPDAAAPVAKKKAHGPYDRYIAPEMQSYTPVYRAGHQLLMPTMLNDGNPRLFILDTGAWTTSIDPQDAREVTKIHALDRLQVKGISGNVEKVYIADKVTLKFAHLSQQANGIVCLDTSRLSKNSKLEIAGFLGATTLEILTIHIDYRDGLVKFDYDPKR